MRNLSGRTLIASGKTAYLSFYSLGIKGPLKNRSIRFGTHQNWKELRMRKNRPHSFLMPIMPLFVHH